MKTQVTIVGVGERRTGTSKTGRQYDFVPVAFTFESRSMEGLNAGSCNVDGSYADQLYPGAVVEAVLIYRNYQPTIACIL